MRLARSYATDDDGAQVAYHVAGAGPPLLLLHGLGGTADVWQPLIADLATRATVICPDLLGFGFSDKPTVPYTPARHVLAVRAVLRALQVDRLDAMVGHSCGGVVAVTLAAAQALPVARLVLASTPYPSPRFAVRRELLRAPLDRAMLAWTPLATLAHRGLSLAWPLLQRIAAPPDLRGAWAGYLDHTVFSYVSTAEECLFRANLDPLLPALHALPTLLLYSPQDRTVPAVHGQRLAAQLPRSLFHLVAGGHFAVFQAAGRQVVRDWLAAQP